jgi:hypothetical protein
MNSNKNHSLYKLDSCLEKYHERLSNDIKLIFPRLIDEKNEIFKNGIYRYA